MDFSHLSEMDRMRMMQLVEQKQAKDAMQMYVRLVDRCFVDCIADFTSKTLVGKEEQCIEKCCDKFMKYSARAGQRFQEQNQLLMQSQYQQLQPQQQQP